MELIHKIHLLWFSLRASWEMREIDPCPPCPGCHHKHRASACVCGCQNKSWREYPQPDMRLHWVLRRLWFWFYDLSSIIDKVIQEASNAHNNQK